MNYEMIIQPEAEEDILSVCLWYEGQTAGLADDFLLCLDALLARIQRSPHGYPVIGEDVRRALVGRFPYGVFYAVEPARIIVLAVIHNRRDPARWPGAGTRDWAKSHLASRL